MLVGHPAPEDECVQHHDGGGNDEQGAGCQGNGVPAPSFAPTHPYVCSDVLPAYPAGSEATEDDIRRHLEPKISKIEMPAEIEFRDALPKTMIGKLSKKELKAEEEQRRKAKAK